MSCAWRRTAVLLLTCAAALPPPCAPDSSDFLCLTRFSAALEDPLRTLRNWTEPTFSDPCDGFTSYLQGATCNNGRVYKLSLSHLSLAGSISPYLSNCTNLQALDLSSNSLSGPIPPDLRFLVNLAVLNLSDNLLSASVPPQLALCAYLNVIDLHRNRLSGPLPSDFGLLARLTAFDVSDNRISGPVPASLARFNASSFEGNKGLFGYPLPPKSSGGLSVLAIVGIGLGSGVVSLVLSFTAVCAWLRVTEQNRERNKPSNPMTEY